MLELVHAAQVHEHVDPVVFHEERLAAQQEVSQQAQRHLAAAELLGEVLQHELAQRAELSAGLEVLVVCPGFLREDVCDQRQDPIFAAHLTADDEGVDALEVGLGVAVLREVEDVEDRELDAFVFALGVFGAFFFFELEDLLVFFLHVDEGLFELGLDLAEAALVAVLDGVVFFFDDGQHVVLGDAFAHLDPEVFFFSVFGFQEDVVGEELVQRDVFVDRGVQQNDFVLELRHCRREARHQRVQVRQTPRELAVRVDHQERLDLRVRQR